MEPFREQNPCGLSKFGLPTYVIGFGKQYPRKVIHNVLLELYNSLISLQVSSDIDRDEIKVMQRTLVACCLVCHQWHEILTSIRGRGVILERNKITLIPSLPRHKLQPILLQQSETEFEQWFPQNYAKALIDSHPKFLPELMPNLIQWLYIPLVKGSSNSANDHTLEPKQREGPCTLAACCLVCHEWNNIFTPILYGDISLPLDEDKFLISQSLLHRTLRHTQPAHKALVKTLLMAPAKDGSTSNLLSICFSMPNLHTLTLNFDKLDPTTLHPNFGYHLRFLSRHCTIQMGQDRVNQNRMNISWELWPKWVSLIRRSRSISPQFHIANNDEDGE